MTFFQKEPPKVAGAKRRRRLPFGYRGSRHESAVAQLSTFGNNRTRPMDSTVSLSFRYLESDYVRALRTHYASRLRLRLDVVVIVILAGIGAYSWRSPMLV